MGFKRRHTAPSEGLEARITAVVPKLFAADRAYTERLGLEPADETFEEALGIPSTAAQLEELESFLGRRLPPSYRAFLSLYGGWRGMPGCAGADLLGPDDHRSPHIQSTLRWKSDLFDEFEETNPIKAGAIPLAIGDDRNMFLLEPPARDDGEMAIVKYYLTEEEGRYTDLAELFEQLLQDRLEQ